MFSPSPLDKNCINSDSCSSSRNNAPNRFSVGITPLGDENQQIRIQLAVHKYNGTTGSPFSNRCSFMSPIRHSFLKNSLKVRNYEGDQEGTSKTDKRKGNQYEGVGSFPTVHLKKNAVRYRPIKRLHDVKIPYPEIPVNKFLSHLPEVCPDIRSSTRSVLDVLEDLSGNKIPSKDDSSGKPKPRGLGGDYLLNPNAVFKPLFVQKPKLNTVLTRDNTTQTLFPVSVETPSPQSGASSYIRNGPHDPKAELRRKLAKQNNEIFASLSSSISSAFCLKRKIDKVLPSKNDGQSGEGSVLKKTRTVDYFSRESNENGISKPAVIPTTNSKESVKSNRKTKFTDANSVSPKDRLTTIFLDTRNTSPKARVFQANTSSESKSVERSLQATTDYLVETNGESADKMARPLTNTVAGGKGKDESSQNSVNFSSSEKSSICGSDKQEMEQSDKAVVSLGPSKSSTGMKDTQKSTSPNLQVDANIADNSNFSSPKSQTGNAPNATETFQSAGNENGSEKKESNGSDTTKGFVFGSSNNKPNFVSFKFGANGNTSFVQNKAFTDFKTNSLEPVSVCEPVTSTTQFSLSTASKFTISPLQTSTFRFGVASSQNTITSPGTTTVAFGHNPLPSQQKSATTDGKNEMSNTMTTPSSSSSSTITTTTTTTTTQSPAPLTLSFGQKSDVSSASTSANQDVPSPANHMSQSKAISFITNFNQKSPNSTESSELVLALGQKSETSIISGGSTAVVLQQVEAFPFTFGQKSHAGQNEAEIESGQNQKSANLFLAEQKPVSQQQTQVSATATEQTAPIQPSITQINQTFAQNVSPAVVTPQDTFTQNSASQTSVTFGTKLEGSSLDGVPTPRFNSNNNVFPNKTLTFGPSVNVFGKTTTQTTAGFATSSSTAPAFSFAVPSTTRSIPTFGGSPATQSPSTFGSSSTPQSMSVFSTTPAVQTVSAFGASTSRSAPGFTASPATQTPPTFGVSSVPQPTPTFRSSNKQSVPSFGTTSTTQSTSTFPGVSSQPAPLFGTSVTTQTTFAAPSGFGLRSSQSTTVFGAPTSTQSSMTFEPSTTQNSTFGPSAGFSTAPVTQPTTTFGPPAPTSTPAFAPAHSLEKSASLAHTPNIFALNPSPAFSSSTTFPSTQNNIFAQKPTTEPTMFGQNKLETSGFGLTPPSFGSQNKFSFGMSTSNATGFTTSPPSTSAPLLFSFGGSSSGNAFTAGSNSSGSNNTPTPFTFRTPAKEPFKFGATATTAATTTTTTTTTTTKEGGGFGGAAADTFSVGSQINNPPMGEQKPCSTQTSTTGAGFNFRTTPSPSLFSFGGSTSSGSSGSSFNFGTPTNGVSFVKAASPGTGVAVPGTFNMGSSGCGGSNFNFGTSTSGVGCGQGVSPGAPFAVPGTFNIGSGSSQSRPRASSRPRRRP